MTEPLTPVQQFGAALRRAMGDRTRVELYRPLGVDTTLAKRWIAGECYPDHGAVLAIAELLHAPDLIALSVRHRTGVCEACGGRTFTTRGSIPARYCGKRCLRRARDRVVAGRRLTQDRKVLTYRLEEHVEAVAAYCKECSGAEHVCRDDECRLRSVSPLPFIPLASMRRRVA